MHVTRVIDAEDDQGRKDQQRCDIQESKLVDDGRRRIVIPKHAAVHQETADDDRRHQEVHAPSPQGAMQLNRPRW